ncbi:hypothetical protein GCM10010349_75250 [Streptomyces flavofungini]|nr:hypothetical protein GCM10010349_75250 [Streptomyces flavofungini]
MAVDVGETGTTEGQTVRAVYRQAGDQLVEVGLDQLPVEERQPDCRSASSAGAGPQTLFGLVPRGGDGPVGCL